MAERRPAAAPTTTGSSGGTPRTPTSAASCGCSPTCRWTRSPGWKRCKAPRSTRPRRCWPTRPPPCCTARRRPKAAAEAARRRSKGRLGGGPADLRDLPRAALAAGRPRPGAAGCAPTRRRPRRVSHPRRRRLAQGGGSARLNDNGRKPTPSACHLPTDTRTRRVDQARRGQEEDRAWSSPSEERQDS